MIPLRQLRRLIHINRVLLRYGLDDLLLVIPFFRSFDFVKYILPWRWFRAEDTRPLGIRIRSALEELGPIFVKFGQALSTRRDLLPLDIANELALLQDRVPPFSGALARQTVEKIYKEKLERIFLAFDEKPLASASIAQVHVARLREGQDVVVKILRPGIEKLIKQDVELLKTVASFAERYWQEARRLRPLEVVLEFEKTLWDELDLLREAANASQLRRNFLHSPLLYIPEVHWPYTRRSILVMERISGIPVGNVETLIQHNVDLKKLSEAGVEIFFTQVFRDNFFHADMHPGNIFVSPQGQYIAVDFGIVGTLNHSDQRYLAENFLAFFNRDYRRVAQLHVESGWVPAGTRVDEFESAIRCVCEPIFERPLQDISFGHLLLRLFQTARRFDMEVQPQLVLLQKTLLNIEGLGRQLYPQLDLWTTAKPFLEKWMANQLGPSVFLQKLKLNFPEWVEALPNLPKNLAEALKSVQAGALRVELRNEEILRIGHEIRVGNQKLFAAIVGGSLIIGAAVIVGLDGYAPQMLGSAPISAWLLGCLGALVIFLAWPKQYD